MSLNLSIKPSVLEIVARPGASFTQAYTIINNSDQPAKLNTSVLPFIPQGNNGEVTYEQAPPNSNIEFSLLNADLSLGQDFVLKPGEKKQLVLKIRTESNIPQNDSYYTFFINQTNSDTSQGRLGAHILLASSDTENPEISASISHLQITPTLRDTFLTPLNFSAQINNQGSHYFKTDGTIAIVKNGTPQKEFKIFPQNVLAGYSRQLTCADDQWNVVPCQLKPPFWPGAYTISINSNGVSTSTTFFIFPVSIMGLALVVILIFWLLKRKLNPKYLSP